MMIHGNPTITQTRHLDASGHEKTGVVVVWDLDEEFVSASTAMASLYLVAEAAALAWDLGVIAARSQASMSWETASPQDKDHARRYRMAVPLNEK